MNMDNAHELDSQKSNQDLFLGADPEWLYISSTALAWPCQVAERGDPLHLTECVKDIILSRSLL